jgi:hypothetical protein
MARRLSTLIAISCALVVAAPGVADGATSPPIGDCTSHGHLTRHYSVSQLRTALTVMPADVQEYTNCYDVIQQAMLAQISGHRADAPGSPSSSSGSSFLSTPIIVAIVIVALGGATAGAIAIRRRGSS